MVLSITVQTMIAACFNENPRKGEHGMNLYQLRYFAEAAKFGSFNKAAGKLHVDQSTLSKQILALEQELNTRLFERTHHGIQLTDNGHAALVRTQEILEKQEELLHLFRAHKKQHIKLGVLSSLSIFFLPSLASSPPFNDMSIEYIIQNNDDLELSLRTGAIDLFIGDKMLSDESLSLDLFREHYKLIMGSGTRADLSHAQRKLVITKRPCRTRALVLPYLYSHNMNFSSYIEVESVFTATSLVSSGLGFSIVPNSAACAYNGYAENVDELYRDIYVVANPNIKGIRLAHLIKNLSCDAANKAGIHHVCPDI